MPIPDLLTEHIDLLKAQGFEIEVIDVVQEICIIFKNYALPRGIWSRDTVDLLVITHPSYPNAKMDMFWVDPAITLKNGSQPKSVSSLGKCNRTWQQFSWHVSTWNPARDNVITYLDVVNERLRRGE